MDLQSLSENWNNLVELAEKLEIKSGQDLFYEGHHPVGIYLLVQGKISLSHPHTTEDQILLDEHNKYFLGIDALVSGTPFSFNAKVIENSEVLFISRTNFLDWYYSPAKAAPC